MVGVGGGGGGGGGEKIFLMFKVVGNLDEKIGLVVNVWVKIRNHPIYYFITGPRRVL